MYQEFETPCRLTTDQQNCPGSQEERAWCSLGRAKDHCVCRLGLSVTYGYRSSPKTYSPCWSLSLTLTTAAAAASPQATSTPGGQ
ncbi:hypothetical protein ElyMa_006496900 [Elysia marginata]|uniref:EB domain-containing protein n=1 Tax=Elysia marginata TaxID=1093978 RepID=A0AAV4I3C5_9GAST|nr:hypothetical protein ElyMa_006496900 [Elysia marginata]